MNCVNLRTASRWRVPCLVAAAAFLVSMTSVSLSAAAITGGFGTTSAGVEAFSNLAGTTHYIDWCPIDTGSPGGSASCGTSTNGMGTLTAQGGSGSFTAVNPSSSGTILDMSDAVSPPFTNFPVGTPVSIDNWLTLAALPDLNFQANMFVPQTCTATADLLCIGGFRLVSDGAGDTTVTMTIKGTVIDTTGTLSSAAFTDVISGQFNNETPAQVAAAAGTTAGIFSNTWSGSINTTAVPEPATFGLLGIAFLGLGLMKNRRARG